MLMMRKVKIELARSNLSSDKMESWLNKHVYNINNQLKLLAQLWKQQQYAPNYHEHQQQATLSQKSR